MCNCYYNILYVKEYIPLTAHLSNKNNNMKKLFEEDDYNIKLIILFVYPTLHGKIKQEIYVEKIT